MTQSEVTDSPTEWVNAHIHDYLADPENGHDWRGVPTLLLTTTGRRSGVRRRTALIYGVDGDDLVIVASVGGQPQHPSWYFNLSADPRVTVQVRDEVFEAVARTAEGAERERLWTAMAEIWPDYEQYQTRTDREIPVVVLSREGDAA